jgi:hypothetical protein
MRWRADFNAEGTEYPEEEIRAESDFASACVAAFGLESRG